MFQSRYQILEAFGIPVYVNGSFLFLLILFMIDFGSFSFGFAAALLLALSVTAHELAHALTARLFGCRTRDITLSLLGGCASLIALPRKASQELLTALAGPLMSFLLAGLFFSILAFVPIDNRWLAHVLLYGMWMNIMLGGFNLLPGFPMDGGRIFRSAMRLFFSRVKATYIAMWVGRAFAVLLALRGLHAVLTRGPWGFISILIAWMIWREGYREYLAARAEENFQGWSPSDLNVRVSPPPYDRS